MRRKCSCHMRGSDPPCRVLGRGRQENVLVGIQSAHQVDNSWDYCCRLLPVENMRPAEESSPCKDKDLPGPDSYYLGRCSKEQFGAGPEPIRRRRRETDCRPEGSGTQKSSHKAA